METDTEFITEDMKLAVKKGANWLDENHPNWAQYIDLNNFEMHNCERCVIGQAVGNYTEIVFDQAKIGPFSPYSYYDWAVENGFDVPYTSLSDNYETNFKNLETLWTEEVCKRLGGN